MGDVDEVVDTILKGRFISPNYLSFLADSLHLFSEKKKPPIDHNESVWTKWQSTSASIKAIDDFPKAIENKYQRT